MVGDWVLVICLFFFWMYVYKDKVWIMIGSEFIVYWYGKKKSEDYK